MATRKQLPMSVRLSPEHKRLLVRLSKKLMMPQGRVMAEAIRRMAEAEGLLKPTTPADDKASK